MATFVEPFDAAGLAQPWTTLRDNFPWSLNGDGTATIRNQGGNTYQRLDRDTESTDHYAEAVIARGWANVPQGDPRAVLLLRAATGTTQTYYAASLQLTNGVLSFLYWQNGAVQGGGPFGAIGNQSVTIPPGSDPITFRFEVEGSTFRAYLDGELVKTETDTRRTVGTLAGAGVQRGTTIVWDDFRAGALSDVWPPEPEPEPEPEPDPSAPTYLGVAGRTPFNTTGDASTDPEWTREKTITVSAEAGELLVLDARTYYTSPGNPEHFSVPSGLGWQRRAYEAFSDNRGGGDDRTRGAGAVWTAVAPATGDYEVTLRLNRNWPYGFAVHRYADHSGVGAVAVSGGFQSAAQTAITTQGDHSAIHYGTADPGASGVLGQYVYLTDTAGVVDTEREVYQYAPEQFTRVAQAVYLDTGQAGGKLVGYSSPQGVRWSAIAVEVLGGGAGEPPRDATGTGASPAVLLDAEGTGQAERTGDGAAAAQLDARGTGSADRDGDGAQGVTVDATGTGSTERAGGGAQGVTVDVRGTGRRVATGRGRAGITLGVDGRGSGRGTRGAGRTTITLDTRGDGRRSATGAGATGVEVAGGGSGPREAAGAGRVGAEVRASGSGRLDATGSGSAAVTVGITGQGRRTAEGSGAVSVALSGSADPGERAATGSGSAEVALDARGESGPRIGSGSGSAGVVLDAIGDGAVSYTGSTGVALGARGTGHTDRAGSGSTGAVLDTQGSGQAERTGTGRAGVLVGLGSTGHRSADGQGSAEVALDTAGDGTAHRLGSGEATLEVGATGSGDRTATGSGSAEVVLDATGESRERAGTGSAGVELTAAGSGRRIAYGRGRAGLTLGAGGTGTSVRAGSGTAAAQLAAGGTGHAERSGTGRTGVELGRACTGTRTARGRASCSVRLGRPAGTGARRAPGRGTAALTLDALGVGRRTALGRGSTEVALDAPGRGSGRFAPDGSGRAGVELLAYGRPARTGQVLTGTGRAGVLLLARPRQPRPGRLTAAAAQAGLTATAHQARLETST